MTSLPIIKFASCPVLIRNEKPYFVWHLSDETKDKIRNFLSVKDLEFGFNNTLEEVPPFFCPVCGVEITLFDQVRMGLSSNTHTRELLIHALQQKEIIGTGAIHNIACENDHAQIIPMGWASGFGWTYE